MNAECLQEGDALGDICISGDFLLKVLTSLYWVR